MSLRYWLVLIGVTLGTLGGVRADEAREAATVDAGSVPAFAEEAFAEETAADDEATAEVGDAALADDETADDANKGADDAPAAEKFELFDAMSKGAVDVTLIGKSDRECRLIIRNVSDKTVDIRLPEAFAGVPTVLAQFGGGGGGRGGGGGGFGGGGGGGGGNQSFGGGGGGMGGGMGGMGGGGGFFSIPPEKVSKINLPVVCLDHGKKDPSSSVPYTLMPAEQHVDRPEVIVLLKALGRGELHQHAAQAAVWHLNNDLSWQELASKLQGTVRNFNRPPYFSRHELQLALTYTNEAVRRAQYETNKSEREQYEATYSEDASDDVHDDDDDASREDASAVQTDDDASSQEVAPVRAGG